jgi:hypothetical protein
MIQPMCNKQIKTKQMFQIKARLSQIIQVINISNKYNHNIFKFKKKKLVYYLKANPVK